MVTIRACSQNLHVAAKQAGQVYNNVKRKVDEYMASHDGSDVCILPDDMFADGRISCKGKVK